MAEVRERSSVDDTLHLALDLCLGLGAFVVTLTGAARVVVSEAMPPEDGSRRIELLARECLLHPMANGGELFWNAEAFTEADSADQSLACVVVPVWADGIQTGLLGVVDTWLPEPDERQRVGLRALAEELTDWVARSSVLFPSVAVGGVDGHPATIPPSPPDRPGSSEAFAEQQRPRPEPAAHAAGAADGVHSAAGGAAAGTGTPSGGTLLRSILDHLPDAVLVTRTDGTIVLVNGRFTQMVGRSAEQLVGSDVRRVVVVPPGGAPGAAAADLRSARRLVVRGPSGEELPVTAVDSRIEGVWGANGHGAGGDCFVTVLRPAPSADGCSASVRIDCVDLVGNLDDGVLCLDGSGTVVLANRAADRFHGLLGDRTLVGSPLPDMTGLRTEDGQLLTLDAHPGMLALREGAACAARFVLGGEGDHQQHVTVTARPFPVDGQRGALVVLHDSTDGWLEQRRLTQYALYDPLTGLANRYLLLEELRRMLLLLGRQGGAVALVYLDLDGFKHINDDHGHDMGDEVLAAVARRLRGAVRSDDVVARLGGDEFVIAHSSSAEHLPDGDLVVSRLRKVLSAPFRVRSQVFDVGASIGWVSTDRGEEGPDALLAKADRAMYLQKRTRAAARRASA